MSWFTGTRKWLVVGFVLVFATPGVVWMVRNESLGVNAVALLAIGLLFALATAATVERKEFWPWALGVLAVLATPALLVLGGALAGKARPAFYNWTYVYSAGAIGGLVLELLAGKGRVELPSFVAPPDTDPAGESEDDAFAPYGARYDLGFFARVALGGVGGAAFIALLQAANGKTDIQTFSQTAKHMDTLGLAAVIGAAAVTIWKSAEAVANARLAPVLAGEVADDLEQLRQTITPEPSAPDSGGGPAGQAIDIDAITSSDVVESLMMASHPAQIEDIVSGLPRVTVRSAEQQAEIARAHALIDSALRTIRRTVRRR